MSRRETAPKAIRDYFYETRVLMGRDFTVKRFAVEVLEGAVDPVMLGYIEKGKRLPNEALVRRLAAVRGEEAGPLIAVLYRDRMLYAFGRELKRALHDPAATEGVADADLAVQVSRAIAALPDDGAWITVRAWREQISSAVRGKAKKSDVDRVVALLRERELVESKAGKVRRVARHFVASGPGERRALAMEFAAIFAKSLLDKLTVPGARGLEPRAQSLPPHRARAHPGILRAARSRRARSRRRVRRRPEPQQRVLERSHHVDDGMTERTR